MTSTGGIIYLPLVACGPGVLDVAQCTPVTLLVQAAAVSATASILGVAAYLAICTLRRLRGLGERTLALLTGAAFFLVLCTLQGGIALVGLAHFLDVYLASSRGWYARQTGATDEQAAATLRLTSAHLAIWAAGVLGILASFVTLLDAVVRLCFPELVPDTGRSGATVTARRAKTSAAAGGGGGGPGGGGGGASHGYLGEPPPGGGGGGGCTSSTHYYPTADIEAGSQPGGGGARGRAPAAAEPQYTPPAKDDDNPFFNRGGGVWPPPGHDLPDDARL